MNRLTRLILPLLGCSGVVFALAVKADEARIAAAIASDNRSEAYVAQRQVPTSTANAAAIRSKAGSHRG